MNQKIRLDISKPSLLPHIVKKKILELIEEGSLKNGDRLPPERIIAEENGISRGTVRTAMQELTKEGIITRYPKRGTFLTTERRPAAKTIRIGVISPLLSLTSTEKTDFYQNEMLGGVQNGFMETGALPVFLQNDLKNNEQMERLSGKDVDGILFLLPLRSQTGLLHKIQEADIPLMIVGATPEGNFNFVGADNRQGIETALKFLVAMGHEKIAAIFSNLDYFDSYYRHISFVDSLQKSSLPCRKEWIHFLPQHPSERWNEDSLKEAVEILNSNERPSAIITGGGYISLGVKKAIEDMGLKIPGDVSLIGFDDFYSARYLTPPLTAISQPVWKMGELAVKKLVEIIANRSSQPCRTVLETEIVARDSVARVKKP